MYVVNLGGTAIGSAINVPEQYLHQIVPTLSELTGYPVEQAEDLFDATENLDGFVTVSYTHLLQRAGGGNSCSALPFPGGVGRDSAGMSSGNGKG